MTCTQIFVSASASRRIQMKIPLYVRKLSPSLLLPALSFFRESPLPTTDYSFASWSAYLPQQKVNAAGKETYSFTRLPSASTVSDT